MQPLQKHCGADLPRAYTYSSRQGLEHGSTSRSGGRSTHPGRAAWPRTKSHRTQQQPLTDKLLSLAVYIFVPAFPSPCPASSSTHRRRQVTSHTWTSAARLGRDFLAWDTWPRFWGILDLKYDGHWPRAKVVFASSRARLRAEARSPSSSACACWRRAMAGSPSSAGTALHSKTACATGNPARSSHLRCFF